MEIGDLVVITGDIPLLARLRRGDICKISNLETYYYPLLIVEKLQNAVSVWSIQRHHCRLVKTLTKVEKAIYEIS